MRLEAFASCSGVMADRFVKRREQPLVSRRKHDQVPARLELVGGPLELGAVVGDVLEHIHVEDRVEPIVLVESASVPTRAAAVRQFAPPIAADQAVGQRSVRLEADPAIERAAAQSLVVSPFPARPRAPRGRDMARPPAHVCFPVLGRSEKIELGAAVDV